MRLPFAGRVISEVCYTFMSNDLRGCAWSQEKKGRLQVLWSTLDAVFVSMSTLASNAMHEKHIHREENSWCWRCSTHMAHVSRTGCMFCFNPTLAWSCGQNTCAWFSAKSTPEEQLQSYFIWKESSYVPQGPSRVNHKGCPPKAHSWTELRL